MKFKPVEDWDEEYLINEVLIPTGVDEYSWIEFKGKEIFDDFDNFDNQVAKQLSGFGNAEGGYLIFGINDDTRRIDGGIVKDFKKEPKNWLTQKIPNLTDDKTTDYDIKLIEKTPNGSAINEGCVIIVVEIRPHEKAPIQSTKDLKFYLRMSDHTLPMTKQ